MKRINLHRSLFLLGLLSSVLPPAIASLCYFPLWREAGAEVTLSGFAAILLTVSFVPLFKFLREKLKSPASYVVWLMLFLIFFILSKVADQLVVITFTGFVGNLVGALLFKLSARLKLKEKD